MSQVPQPPGGVGPEDFAPAIGAPRPEYQQPGSRTNGWAIASLVSGLLGCVPYATGVIAVITGIVGLKTANDPRYTGRGLAIGGIVLGALSLVFWLFFSTTVIGLLAATGQPRKLAQEFVKLTSDDAVDAAMAHAAPNISRAEVEALATEMTKWGGYQDVSSYGSSINVAGGVTTCELNGTATFTEGEHPFTMTLIKDGDAWKVADVEFE